MHVSLDVNPGSSVPRLLSSFTCLFAYYNKPPQPPPSPMVRADMLENFWNLDSSRMA